MSDEDLIGYLFDLLTPDERAVVAARVQSDTDIAARLNALRANAAPLLAVAAVERDEPPVPRPGLALRAIATVAQYVVEHEPRDEGPLESSVDAFLREYADEPPDIDIVFGPGTRAPVPAAPPPSDGPDYRAVGRFRADLLVAAGIALVGVGLVLSAVSKVRHNARATACQNNLRELHNGLVNYANSNDGRYPQVGDADVPTAGAFATALIEPGYLRRGCKPECPATPEHHAYAYTLGFRENGALTGLRRPPERSDSADANDLMPISADLPATGAAPGSGPISPHGRTMHVLFVGGHVRATTSPNIGPGEDHIYSNWQGAVAAGAGRTDAVLGRPGDKP